MPSLSPFLLKHMPRSGYMKRLDPLSTGCLDRTQCSVVLLLSKCSQHTWHSKPCNSPSTTAGLLFHEGGNDFGKLASCHYIYTFIFVLWRLTDLFLNISVCVWRPKSTRQWIKPEGSADIPCGNACWLFFIWRLCCRFFLHTLPWNKRSGDACPLTGKVSTKMYFLFFKHLGRKAHVEQNLRLQIYFLGKRTQEVSITNVAVFNVLYGYLVE